MLVAAGWEEREAETAALEKHLGAPVANLSLWPACEAAFEADHERERRCSRATIGFGSWEGSIGSGSLPSWERFVSCSRAWTLRPRGTWWAHPWSPPSGP